MASKMSDLMKTLKSASELMKPGVVDRKMRSNETDAEYKARKKRELYEAQSAAKRKAAGGK